MDTKEFNELLKLHKYDSTAKEKFCRYCFLMIKHRLIFRGVKEDAESTAHSVLEYFLLHVPTHYVFAPRKYLFRAVDNFLSNRKKKESRVIINDEPCSYEQRFDGLEKSEIYCILVKLLGKVSGSIFYLYGVDDMKEYEIARKFNMSYAATRKRISRCKQKLKKYFAEDVTKPH